MLPLLIAGAALAIPLFAQHEKDGEDKKHPFIGDAKEIAAGQKLFASGCAACHGMDGKGGRGPNLVERVFWHPLDEDTLYKAVQKGIPAGGMPPANLPEDDAWRVVAYVRSLTAPAIETPVAGNAAAGEKLFWGKAGCGNCHALRGGPGGRLGPDLGNVAATRSIVQLRESILDPNADGAPGYRAATVTLKDGRQLKGVVRNRTNYSVQLQDAQGKLHLLAVRDVAKLTIGDGSPMPGDFAKKLAKEEIDDIVAFLAKQSVRSAEMAKK